MGFFDFLRKKQGTRTRRALVARTQLQVEALESRVVPYSVSGNAWPNPQLVTISFVPDGTIVGSNSNGYIYSNLFATLNAKFGSPSVWENAILQGAQAWAQQTNLNFAVVPDSGADMGSGNYQQGDPTMGDIRIGGYNFGNSYLAQTYMPPPINNFSLAGDMQFNTGKPFSIGTGGYDLQTVAMHEMGHALGLYHSGYSVAEMYPTYNAIKHTLNSDDINGIQAMYGAGRTPDSFNGGSGTQSLVGGVLNTVTGVLSPVTNLLGGLLGGGSSSSSGNGSFASASDLTSYIDPNALTGALGGLDLTTSSQVEYFTVTVPQNTSGTFTLDVQSSGLSLLDPTATVYAADQLTVLASATGSGYQGSNLMLTVNNVTPGQVLYFTVGGAVSNAFGTGNYGISMDFGNPASLVAVPVPNTQVLNGNPLSSGGGQAIKTQTGAKQYHAGINAEAVVNTYTAGAVTADGARPVGMDANGNYVVVWSSQGEDGSGWGVYGQRYDVNGNPLGGEFQVNTTTAGDQNQPSVAVAPDGSFMVVWQSQGQDGSGWGVYGQRYDASGNRIGGEFQVNTTTAGDQDNASVATDGQGNYFVTWQSQVGSGWSIYGQRYNALGSVGGEIQISTTSAGDQQNARVAMSSNGTSVVVWQSHGPNGFLTIYGQQFDANGNPLGGAFQASTYTAGDQVDPSVGMSAAGAFVVTWSSNGQDGSGWGVYGQRFFGDGTTNGQAFLVNVTTAGDQNHSSVTMDSNGNFLVAWQSQGSSGWQVFGRQYNAATGAPTGSELMLSSTTTGGQVSPAWGLNDAGNAVALWSGATILAANNSVVMQQFNVSAGNDLNDLSADSFGPADQSPALTTLGVFDPSTGTWYLRNSNSAGAPDVKPFQYGAPGWIGVVGDWTGSGVQTIGVVDPTTMTWYLKNTDTPGAPDITPFRYGAPGWIPVVGDWSGTGHAGIGAFDPTTGTWYLRNEVGAGAPDAGVFRYGAPGWEPVVGDWNGDGITTIGVFDPTSATFYLRNENSQGAPDAGVIHYGGAGWKPVVGDWNGAGITTIGVVDPNGAWYLRNSNTPGAPDITPFRYGAGGWMPVVGAWDGRALPLHLAANAGAPSGNVSPLTGQELQGILAAALARVQSDGASTALMAKLSATQFEIGQLGGGNLALAFQQQGRIILDSTAAGQGWFVDSTPNQDEEFSAGAKGALQALPNGPAAGKVDLLTAVMQELAHAAGLASDALTAPLGVGVRDLSAVDAVFAGGG